MKVTNYHKIPAKRPRREKYEPNGENQVEPESPPEAEDPQNRALSNHVILKNLFSFLNPQDLESCWYVCKLWNNVADPLVCLHYAVEIDTREYRKQPKPIVLTKAPRTNLKSQRKYALSFEEVTKNLEEDLLAHNNKLVLSLKFDFDIGARDETVENFLLKFGPFVQHLGLLRTQGVHFKVFCDFIHRNFRNLRHLDCSILVLLEDPENPDFVPDQPQYKLKKISFGMCKVSSSKILGKLLQIAPNLEEIEKLPIWFINAVVIAGKGQALKSVAYHERDLEPFAKNGVTVVSAFEKLAQLQPKLSSFAFPWSSSLERGISKSTIKPFLFSVLQSSADSLQSFDIRQKNWYGIQNIPQLKGVKKLVFRTPFPKGKCLASDISLLRETFPNINELSILYYLTANLFNGYLPEDTESSWGSQLKRIHVTHLHTSSLPFLGEMYPLIEDFEFSASAYQLAELLPSLAEVWPKLKSMKILIDINDDDLRKPKILDCAFTGLSPKVVVRLLDPSKRRKINATQIRRFESQSIIAKFRELQRLTLMIKDKCTLNDPTQVYTSLTDVANEFGFKLLPQLKVCVGIRKLESTWKVIEAAWEPLARSSNVEIMDFYPR